MLELLMQNWTAQGSASANGSEVPAKPSKDFASVMGEQALSLPIQALLADAVQASSAKGAQAQTEVLSMPLAATGQAEEQVPASELAVDAEVLLQQIDRNSKASDGLDVAESALPMAEVTHASNSELPSIDSLNVDVPLATLGDMSGEGRFEDVASPTDGSTHQALHAEELAGPIPTAAQMVADIKLTPIEAVAAPLLAQESAGGEPEDVAASELARTMNLDGMKEGRSGPTMASPASRVATEHMAAEVSPVNTQGVEELALEAQRLAEQVVDVANSKVPVTNQAVAVGSPTPLLAGVAELSSTLAVNSIASLDAADAVLPQAATSSLQTVAVHELATHALAVIRQRGHEQGDARLALHPAELGSLEMTIEQDGKRLEMSVIVDNEQARSAVSEQLNQLRERLAESGLRLASLDISLRDSGERQNNDKQESADTHATEDAVNNTSHHVVTLSENALDLYA